MSFSDIIVTMKIEDLLYIIFKTELKNPDIFIKKKLKSDLSNFNWNYRIETNHIILLLMLELEL